MTNADTADRIQYVFLSLQEIQDGYFQVLPLWLLFQKRRRIAIHVSNMMTAVIQQRVKEEKDC